MLNTDPVILKNEGLSKGMIAALEDAYLKYKKGKVFSLKDLAGSKTALINRDLLAFSTIYINREPVTTWRLTKKGLSLIRFLNQGLKMPN